MHNVHLASVADREHPADQMACRAVPDLARLHPSPPPVLLVHRDGEDMQLGNIEHCISRGAPARARTTQRVVDYRGFQLECLGRLQS